MFYRLQSFILRFFQVLGAVMAVAGSASAIMWTMQGRGEDALFHGFVAVASIGFFTLAGWMRKGLKKERDFFGL
jgi:hypothetical protein